MDSKKIMSIIMGVIMLGSLGGFAFGFMGIGEGNNQNPHDPNNPSTPTIDSAVIYRSLTQQERSLVLQSGGVIIENIYFTGCSDCEEGNGILSGFANRFSSFVILSQYSVDPVSDGNEDPEEILRMIVGNGQILDLDRDLITDDYLLENFCDHAPAQPAECVLRQI